MGSTSPIELYGDVSDDELELISTPQRQKVTSKKPRRLEDEDPSYDQSGKKRQRQEDPQRVEEEERPRNKKARKKGKPKENAGREREMAIMRAEDQPKSSIERWQERMLGIIHRHENVDEYECDIIEFTDDKNTNQWYQIVENRGHLKGLPRCRLNDPIPTKAQREEDGIQSDPEFYSSDDEAPSKKPSKEIELGEKALIAFWRDTPDVSDSTFSQVVMIISEIFAASPLVAHPAAQKPPPKPPSPTLRDEEAREAEEQYFVSPPASLSSTAAFSSCFISTPRHQLFRSVWAPLPVTPWTDISQSCFLYPHTFPPSPFAIPSSLISTPQNQLVQSTRRQWLTPPRTTIHSNRFAAPVGESPSSWNRLSPYAGSSQYNFPLRRSLVTFEHSNLLSQKPRRPGPFKRAEDGDADADELEEEGGVDQDEAGGEEEDGAAGS